MLQSLQIGGLVDTHCAESDECMLDKSRNVKVLIQFEVHSTSSMANTVLRGGHEVTCNTNP